jgi:hypothetical protein
MHDQSVEEGGGRREAPLGSTSGTHVVAHVPLKRAMVAVVDLGKV